MKTNLSWLLILFTSFCACSKDNSDDTAEPAPANLVTPRISVRVADPLNQNPFTGILEIYPCDNGTSTYYGNYVNGRLTVFNGYYVIVNGSVYGNNNRELHLPIGDYNMVYWGTPKYEEPIYNAPAIVHPGISTGNDLSTLYFGLKANSNGTYMPVYDLVHSVKTSQIGTEDLQTSLTRVTAGIKVIVTQEDNSVFSNSITGMTVHIGNIAEKMNFYSAEAVNMTKTVEFDLTRSNEGTTMSNATVMLFPSSANPLFELIITLADGTEHTLSKNLTSTLSPNTHLTLNITVGKILPDGSPGDFTIESWQEESETIDFPIIN